LKVIIGLVSRTDVTDARLFPALADGSDNPALSFPGRTLTYAELDAATYRVAGSIRRHERVAVIAEPTLETAIAVVGALRAGTAIVPINPRSGSSELEHILSDARPEALLIGPATVVSQAFSGLRIVDVSDDTRIMPLPGIGHGGTGDHPALIVYTSGTTGPPKGAVLPQRAIASNLDGLAQAWEWTATDVVAHALPLFHVHGLVLGILGPLRRGGQALHLGRFAPEAVRDALAGEATMLFGVPTMYRRLADAAEDDPALAAALRRARLLVSGSAALPAAEHARLQRLTGRGVVERYGMTETLMNTAIAVGAPPAPGTVGPAVPGVQVRLVDDDGVEIDSSAGEEAIGEVRVRGPNLFLGYLNRPEATAEALHDGWFATGDMGVWTAEGNLRLVGRRATDLIKSGGYKIGAGEIEAALREHPAVEDAAVTGEPHDDLGERVVAWVVLRDDATAEPQELVDHVAGTLAPHKRPRVVRFLDDLPRNELGKVQKKRLGALD
jgi:malonyl-CoA/methylmalonyl-CoA synthetase